MLCYAREAAKYEIVMVKDFLLLHVKTMEKQRSGMRSGYESSVMNSVPQISLQLHLVPPVMQHLKSKNEPKHFALLMHVSVF